jgi:hypothetical protein
MILDRDAAYLGQTLIDLEIPAIGRQERKPDRRRVTNQLQRWLLSKRLQKR